MCRYIGVATEAKSKVVPKKNARSGFCLAALNLLFNLHILSLLDVIHMIGIPRPYPFSTTFLVSCTILDVNQRTKMGETWECGCRVLINVQTQLN